MRERLHALELSGSGGFDDVGLKALAAYCTQLRALRVGGCAVSAAALRVVVTHCRHLQLVEVSAALRVPVDDAPLHWTALLPSGCVVETSKLDAPAAAPPPADAATDAALAALAPETSPEGARACVDLSRNSSNDGASNSDVDSFGGRSPKFRRGRAARSPAAARPAVR